MPWICKEDCHEHDDFVAEMWESRTDLIVHPCDPDDKEPKMGEYEPKVYVGDGDEITGPWCSGCQKELVWEEIR